MRLKFLLSFFILLLHFCLSAQITQTVRGKVVEKETQIPLPGVTVVVLSEEGKIIGAATDEYGKYSIPNVKIGRQMIKFSYLGYKDVTMPIVLKSGKEYILNTQLEEQVIEIEEIKVTATQKGDVLNEMALISAREFSVEETERYAGSRGDPARMASNFAGVQGSDDSRNDIVVRGNSPLGVIWRVEGVDIPNPNHFAISGSQGGPVSIINNKMMGNSDFFTGAFPAEYGNSLSSVFDLRLRNGNNREYEFSGQFGFLGTELLAEGPLGEPGSSSFLGVYRYSTVGIFSALGINIGTDAVPQYQDASFKINFPNKKGSFSFWGIGGTSNINIKISDQKEPSVDLYGENDRDQFFQTSMGILGMTLSRSINEKTYFKATLSTSLENQKATHDYIVRHIDNNGLYVLDSTYKILDYSFLLGKTSLAFYFNHKINSKSSFKAGMNTDSYAFNYQDSVFNDMSWMWVNRYRYIGDALLAQPYIQFKHKFTDNLVGIAGWHAALFTLNNTSSLIEPRVNLKWNFTPRQSFSAGFGVHSQLQPLYTYFYHKYSDAQGNDILHNINMGFSKSNHYIFGYENYLSSNLRLKTEVYYQDLYNIPVEVNPSSFSMVNAGSGFARFFPDSLKNEGTGTNYGVELTVEKFFDQSFFFLATGSIYDSKYRGSDGIERNTDFNGNYAANVLVGKEFDLGQNSTLSLGIKLTRAGGRRYGLVDTAASSMAREVIFQDSLYNEFQFRDYFRLDTKVNVVINAKKVTHEIALDLVNVLNTQNILNITYAPVPGGPTAVPFRENYQLGFLPIFYYKIDF